MMLILLSSRWVNLRRRDLNRAETSGPDLKWKEAPHSCIRLACHMHIHSTNDDLLRTTTRTCFLMLLWSQPICARAGNKVIFGLTLTSQCSSSSTTDGHPRERRTCSSGQWYSLYHSTSRPDEVVGPLRALAVAPFLLVVSYSLYTRSLP